MKRPMTEAMRFARASARSADKCGEHPHRLDAATVDALDFTNRQFLDLMRAAPHLL